MQNTKAALAAGQSDLANRPVFNVALAYDEFAGGACAKEFFDELILAHGELFQFICRLWKFEVLREPRLFDVAARDAAWADVLAFRQSHELPAEIRRWIGHWLPSKHGGSGALVLLVDDQPDTAGDATTVGATLRQLAENANLQVFCKEIAWPAMDSHFAVQITKAQFREEPRRLAPLPSPYAGQPRWGLNE